MPTEADKLAAYEALVAWGEARRLMRDASSDTSAASYVAEGKARRTIAALADRLAREGSGACEECHGSGTVTAIHSMPGDPYQSVAQVYPCPTCGGGRAG